MPIMLQHIVNVIRVTANNFEVYTNLLYLLFTYH